MRLKRLVLLFIIPVCALGGAFIGSHTNGPEAVGPGACLGIFVGLASVITNAMFGDD